MSELPADVAAYLVARDRDRSARVTAMLEQLTERERELIREVAVMSRVRGVMAGRVGHEEIEADLDVVYDTIAACQEMPDLYPTVDGLSR